MRKLKWSTYLGIFYYAPLSPERLHPWKCQRSLQFSLKKYFSQLCVHILFILDQRRDYKSQNHQNAIALNHCELEFDKWITGLRLHFYLTSDYTIIIALSKCFKRIGVSTAGCITQIIITFISNFSTSNISWKSKHHLEWQLFNSLV